MQKQRWAMGAAFLTVTASLHPARAQHHSAATRRPTVMTQKPAQKPVLLACNMGAMTPAQRQRHDHIAQQLRHAAKEVKELPGGYAFRYASDPELFKAAAEFITLESQCCSFYHFRLEQEPEEGPMWLYVTGPQNAKSFIKPVLAP